MKDVLVALKKHWGFDDLRPLQQEAVSAIFNKQDVLVLLPTGGGKSLCYQLPAISLPGLAIVVSPLISLMQDQVEQLKRRKIKAMHLSGMLSERALDQRLTNAANGAYKLLYISPERLQSDWIIERLSQMDSENARWWLGLAIQQERALDFKSAQVSYQAALSKVGISNQSQRFIKDRLALLQNLESAQ